MEHIPAVVARTGAAEVEEHTLRAGERLAAEAEADTPVVVACKQQ